MSRFLVLRLHSTHGNPPTLTPIAARATRDEAETIADACRADVLRIAKEREAIAQPAPFWQPSSLAEEAAAYAKIAESIGAIAPPRFDPTAPRLEGTLPSARAAVRYLVVEDTLEVPAPGPKVGDVVTFDEIPIGAKYRMRHDDDRGLARYDRVRESNGGRYCNPPFEGEMMTQDAHARCKDYVIVELPST